jgi:hypothetical protein
MEDSMENERKSKLTRKVWLVYTIADVKMVRPDLTAAQCGQVLDEMYNHFDYTVGFTWERMAEVAEELFPADDNTSSLVWDFIHENNQTFFGDEVAGDFVGYRFSDIDREWKKFVAAARKEA